MNTLAITLISVVVILAIVVALKKFTSGWKLFLILWLPIFAATMWYGIAHDFQDIGLYAVAMALAAWGVAGWAIHTVNKWQEWRKKSRGGPDA